MEDDVGVDLTAREKLMLQFGGSCFPFKAHVAVSVENLPNPLRLARKAGQPVRFSVHSSVTPTSLSWNTGFQRNCLTRFGLAEARGERSSHNFRGYCSNPSEGDGQSHLTRHSNRLHRDSDTPSSTYEVPLPRFDRTTSSRTLLTPTNARYAATNMSWSDFR